tara:strand:- start:845 stop:1936 length:1092 start_codon:yes stop_codon:yes gene_type:complete
MAPFKSSLARSAGKLFGVPRERDLSLRGYTQSSRTPIPPFSATGGTVLTPGNGYKYHMFTTPGSLAVSGSSGSVDYLIIGGGGSGGNAPDNGSYQNAGGGGAGEFLTGQISSLQVASYPITIGAGGLYTGGPQGDAPYPSKQGWYGGNGGGSTFNAPGANGVSALDAAGGGSGGGGSNQPSSFFGQVGGSAGGGGGYASDPPSTIAGSGDQYTPGTSSFPSPANGWGSDTIYETKGSGGGGAGQKGGNGNSGEVGGAGLTAFNGDTGIPSSYGTPGPSAGRWFAGGGGRGADHPSSNGPYAGGVGGGGAGGVITPGPARIGTTATANTGSGGGGAGADNYPTPSATGKGGNGAAGIVIIRYAV